MVCCADKAERELGWKAEMGILEMARDMVHWQFVSWLSLFFSFGPRGLTWSQQLNPNGYSSGSRKEVAAGEVAETIEA